MCKCKVGTQSSVLVKQVSLFQGCPLGSTALCFVKVPIVASCRKALNGTKWVH